MKRKLARALWSGVRILAAPPLVALFGLGSCGSHDHDPHADTRPSASEIASYEAEALSPDFEALVAEYARYPVEFETLKPASVAQWLLESQRGHAPLARLHGNFGALRWLPELAEIAGNAPVRFGAAGNEAPIAYVHSPSHEGWFRTYWRSLDLRSSREWRQHAATGEGFLRFLEEKGALGESAQKVVELLPDAERLLKAAGWNEPHPRRHYAANGAREEDFSPSWLKTIPVAPRWADCGHFGFNASRSTRSLSSIRRIVIHNTTAGNWGDGSELIRTVNSYACGSRKASFHFVIGRQGSIIQMVPVEHVAWHAPGANMDGIGIEVDVGTRRDPQSTEILATPAQMESLRKLVRTLMKRFGLKESDVTNHRSASGYNVTDCPDSLWPMNRAMKNGERDFLRWRREFLMEGGDSGEASDESAQAQRLMRPLACPSGFELTRVNDSGGRTCLSETEMSGPFTDAMRRKCLESEGGRDTCLMANRWEKSFALGLRGFGTCPLGARFDAELGYCAEGENVFGPFPPSLVRICKQNGFGDDVCESGRWGKGALRAVLKAYTPPLFRVRQGVANLRNEKIPSQGSYGQDLKQESQLLYNDVFHNWGEQDGWVMGAATHQLRKKQPYEGFIRREELIPTDTMPNYEVTAWAPVTKVFEFAGDTKPLFTVSGGTRFELLEDQGSRSLFKVRLADGTVGYLSYQEARRDEFQPQGSLLRESLVTSARGFVGGLYLWGGLSYHLPDSSFASGVDCSGLTYLAYRANGILIPRNADDQVLEGERIAFSELQKGDLIGVGSTPERTNHIVLYAGEGKIIESHEVGSPSQEVPFEQRFGRPLASFDGDPSFGDRRLFPVRYFRESLSRPTPAPVVIPEAQPTPAATPTRPPLIPTHGPTAWLNMQGRSLTIASPTGTYFKVSDAPAGALQDVAERCFLPQGFRLKLKAMTRVVGAPHFRIRLEEAVPDCSFTEGYIFAEHTEVEGGSPF